MLILGLILDQYGVLRRQDGFEHPGLVLASEFMFDVGELTRTVTETYQFLRNICVPWPRLGRCHGRTEDQTKDSKFVSVWES